MSLEQPCDTVIRCSDTLSALKALPLISTGTESLHDSFFTMLSVSFLIIGTIVLATCQYLRRKWVQHVAYRVAVREHGCQPAPKYPHKDRNGLDLAMIIAHANKKGGNGHKVYEQFLDRFGDTFEQNIFGEKTLVTRDPANIQHVLGTSSKDFERAAPRQIKFVSTVLLGRGILRNVGAAWKRSRDMIKPIFFRGELADVTIINDHVQQLLGQLPRDGSTVDMQDYLQRMVSLQDLDSIYHLCIAKSSPTASRYSFLELVAVTPPLSFDC